jgi:hypothetical protein
MVEFLPNAPLLANTEYRVSAEKYGTFLPDWDMEGRQAAPVNGSYVSGFSTKEGPSVAGIQLISKDGGKSIAYIRVQFSEEVDTQSVKDAIEVQANALTVSGRIPDAQGARHQLLLPRPRRRGREPASRGVARCAGRSWSGVQPAFLRLADGGWWSLQG